MKKKEYRMFDGKKYSWIAKARRKSDAKIRAKHYRYRYECNARVVKGKDYRGRVEYRIYISTPHGGSKRRKR